MRLKFGKAKDSFGRRAGTLLEIHDLPSRALLRSAPPSRKRRGYTTKAGGLQKRRAAFLSAAAN